MTIEYTTASWNPLVGCSPVSPGCAHCYAAREAGTRLAHLPDYASVTRKKTALFERLGDTASGDDRSVHHAFNGTIVVREKLIELPLRKTKPQRYFVCSTSDMFHEKVSDEVRDRMLAVMLLSPWHTYLIITKRPQFAHWYLTDPILYERVLAAARILRNDRPGLGQVGISNPSSPFAPWIWWGVSAENFKEFEVRVYWLRLLPVARRLLSLSPLLEEIALDGQLSPYKNVNGDRPGIDWVIMEGESGPDARPCDLRWLGRMLQSCRDQGVPAYLKQLGDNPTDGISEAGGGTRYVGKLGRGGRDESSWPQELRNNKTLPTFWQPEQEYGIRASKMARSRKG